MSVFRKILTAIHIIITLKRLSRRFVLILRKAPAEGQKFERKMADVENQAREGEQHIDTNRRESLFNVII